MEKKNAAIGSDLSGLSWLSPREQRELAARLNDHWNRCSRQLNNMFKSASEAGKPASYPDTEAT